MGRTYLLLWSMPTAEEGRGHQRIFWVGKQWVCQRRERGSTGVEDGILGVGFGWGLLGVGLDVIGGRSGRRERAGGGEGSLSIPDGWSPNAISQNHFAFSFFLSNE
ncbi:hypothetical protein HAX54_034961 [Datura stramonium]|uniref:Uncharacterized protein n=1 Tax=Datura stramonium TaxID=4076 RepID=A0ABS8SER5_DATST|nr:hypothetical protein [Datura stramonium]